MYPVMFPPAVNFPFLSGDRPQQLISPWRLNLLKRLWDHHCPEGSKTNVNIFPPHFTQNLFLPQETATIICFGPQGASQPWLCTPLPLTRHAAPAFNLPGDPGLIPNLGALTFDHLPEKRYTHGFFTEKLIFPMVFTSASL